MTEKRKVLIVDDAEVMRKEVAALLKDKYETYEAEDGLQALEQVRKVVPDMIILDLEMPVMGGFEFLDKVDEILDPIPPVLILTTISTKRRETREKGAQFYMDKPFEKERLLTVIEHLLKSESTRPN
ncbi:MAG: response regulator [Bdellovibrionota bacterium]|nr:response regulator [Bdellovibrionota bacterium]MEC8623195.1 response regulator [Bdellovibrionota bacterium]